MDNSNILSLQDLDPKETTFTLKKLPGVTLTLCTWSLRVRSWATKKYSSEGLRDIFEKQKIEEIAEITYFMLKDEDKKRFESIDQFFDTIVTFQDQLGIIKALLGALGIGEPEIKKISDAAKTAQEKDQPLPQAKSPKKKIGARSSTP